MPIGKFLWGVSSSGTTPHYENELVCGYVPYDWLTDRPPREGSEFAQAPSGVEDAWITGRDYVFDGEFRWIPDKPVSSSGATTANPERSLVAGPVSWQAFLDYCRDKNDFRFVPNTNVPDFYVEKCYLVEPLRGFGGNLADLTRGVRLVMRSTSMDFTQALRGVALEYKPGAQLRDYSTGATFARAGTGTFVQGASTAAHGHLIGSAGSGVMRDRYRTSSGERATLLEPASTNLVLHPEDLSNAAWTKGGASVTANDRKAPDATGSTTADRLIASSSLGAHYASQAFTAITTGETLSLLVHARADDLTRLAYYVTGTSDGQRVGVDADLAAGTIAVYEVGGATITVGPFLRALDSNWFELSAAGSLNSSSTSVQAVVRLLSSTGSFSFAGATSGQGLHVWGASLARERAPTAYIASSSATASRPADDLRFEWPWKPQGGWVYQRFEERGGLESTASVRYFEIGGSTGGRFILYRSSTGVYQALYDNTSGGSVNAVTTTLSTGAIRSMVELLSLLSTAGAVQLLLSVNGGTEAASTQSAGIALASSWTGATLYVGSNAGGVNTTFALAHLKAGFSTGVTTIAAARSA